MCGICGIYGPEPTADLAFLTQMMTDEIVHRGPDDSGIWSDPSSRIALGHRRLSILDTSETGAQPMSSACGRWQIVFNGEIYNHPALRGELELAGIAPNWRGSSDTETLLASISANGVTDSLRSARGMFALALWDCKNAALYLARDRMGEKPLYCAKISKGWAFASELKPLLALPDFRPQLSQSAIAAYLAHGYVPDNQCIFEDVIKVPPGHLFCIASSSVAAGELPEAIAFQPFEELMDEGLARRAKIPSISEEESLEALEKQLMHVVDEQMLSDVPLGCFLSGGVDSSLIASLMQAQRDTAVRTFSIGFDIARFNEAPHAASVASHLGTEHMEFILSEQDALSVVPELAKIYDEPFADSSQMPTVLLCREARREVTVALTGDGGDEIFGGYNRHIMSDTLLARLNHLPRPARQALGYGLARLAPLVAKEDSWPRRLAAKTKMPVTAMDKAMTLAPVLQEVNSPETLYRHFTRSIDSPRKMLTDEVVEVVGPSIYRTLKQLGTAEWMMAMDSMSYLPGDILVKVDRAAMAASLETRAPFLDARIVTAAWSLPCQRKIAQGQGKLVLRRILDRHVPRALIDRPKQGFAIPVDQWLRGALRGWAEELLWESELFAIAKLDAGKILPLWDDHIVGRANNGTQLWTLIMLLQWLRTYRRYLEPAT